MRKTPFLVYQVLALISLFGLLYFCLDNAIIQPSDGKGRGLALALTLLFSAPPLFISLVTIIFWKGFHKESLILLIGTLGFFVVTLLLLFSPFFSLADTYQMLIEIGTSLIKIDAEEVLLLFLFHPIITPVLILSFIGIFKPYWIRLLVHWLFPTFCIGITTALLLSEKFTPSANDVNGLFFSIFFFLPMFILDFIERRGVGFVTWKWWLIFSIIGICFLSMFFLSSFRIQDATHKIIDPCYEIIEGKGPMWSIKKGRVCMEYYVNALGYTSVKTLEGADPNTFAPLEQSSAYFRDRNTVYYGDTKLKGADPHTTVALEDTYLKDKDSVWYQGERIPDADTSTFRTLGQYYAKTDTGVYWAGKRMPEADPASFEILPEIFARDKYSVYSDGKKFYDADPNKFHNIQKSGFYTDGKSVYYLSYPVQDAHPATFVILDWRCATDGVSYFDGNETVAKGTCH